MDDEVEAFLEHFGTKGMKWGKTRSIIKKEKKETQKAQSVVRGNIILDKNKGNGTRAAAKIVGRAVATRLIAEVGTLAVSKMNTSVSVKAGTAIAANGVSMGMTYKSVKDLMDVRSAVVDRKKNG